MADNKNQPTISINVIAYNEEEEIAPCLKSARLLADEIVFVDNESTDNTKQEAEKYADKVLSFSNHGYVEPARNFGIEKCSGDWVFVLDADERITPELANYLKKLVQNVSENVGAVAVPRKNFTFGFWLKHGGWWPDRQVRFIRKSHFVNWPKEIHSFPEIKGKIKEISIPFHHLTIKDIAEMVERTIRYSQKEAKLLQEADRSTGVLLSMRRMLGQIWKRGIRQKGLLGNPAAVIQVVYQAYSAFITQLRLREINRTNL